MAEFITTTLMDGYAGGPHITETQIGLANQATFGADDYVLEGGRESEAQVLTNNSIRIFDAVYCIQGRRDVIPASGYTDVTIANGTQGMNRNDIIVRRYKKNESSEIESTEYAVIKGTPNAGAAVDPEVTTGDIRSGATLHEMALYRVKITGLNITAVEPMFNILKNMASLQKELTELNSKSGDVAQNNVTQQVYNLLGGALIVVGGTKKVTLRGSDDYIQLITKDELRELFGSEFDPQRLTIITNNGDALITDVHLYEPEYWKDSGNYYQYYYPKVAGDCRINYLMVYRPAINKSNSALSNDIFAI